MIRIEDYSDEDLRDELVQRGYAVYEGKDMKQCITKLEGLEKNLLSNINSFYTPFRLNKIKKGDKRG